jgi:hypothetical protein
MGVRTALTMTGSTTISPRLRWIRWRLFNPYARHTNFLISIDAWTRIINYVENSCTHQYGGLRTE